MEGDDTIHLTGTGQESKIKEEEKEEARGTCMHDMRVSEGKEQVKKS